MENKSKSFSSFPNDMEKEYYLKGNNKENKNNNNLTYEINKFNNNFNKSLSMKKFENNINNNQNKVQPKNNLSLSVKNIQNNNDKQKLIKSYNYNNIENSDNTEENPDKKYKKYFININGNNKNEEIFNKKYSLNSNFYPDYKEVNIEKLNKKILKLKKENHSLIHKLHDFQKLDELSKLKLDEKQKEIITLQNNLLKLNDVIKEKDEYIIVLKAKINNLNYSNNGKAKNIDLLTSKLLNYEKEEKNLSNTIELLNNAEIKNKYLKEEINSIKKIDEKNEQLLNIFFNFYNKINYILNYSPEQKWKRKEILNDVINYENLEDFEEKLNKLIKKCEKNAEEIRLRIGKFFPCDITCCATKNERMKYFKK